MDENDLRRRSRKTGFNVATLEKEFNLDKIRDLFILKCQITGIEFNPDLIFDENRLSEAKKFWTIALARLTKNLPDFESVVKDLRLMLDFIKVK